MSCTRNLQFCVNHAFLLNIPKSKVYDQKFVNCMKEILPQLQNLLEYYQKHNEKSVDVFKKSDAKEFAKNFVIKLSQYLNLSTDVCYELLKSYLLCDGKLGDNDLQSMLTRGYNTISLMQKIRKFYYEERMSLIRMSRYVFSEWKEEFQMLSTIILTAAKFDSKKSFFLKLLRSYKSLIDDMYQDKSSCEYRDDNLEDDLIVRSLEEQAELLETLLMGAYSLKECRDKETFQQVLDVFKWIDFGTVHNVSKIVSSRTSFQNLVEKISFIQSLVLIELAGIETMFVEQDQLRNHFLFDGKCLSQLNRSVTKLGSRHSHGVMLLFMSLMHNYFQLEGPNTVTLANKMAEMAIVKLDLFNHINSVLTNKPYLISSSEGSYLGLVVHCVLFDLFSLLCNTIHLNSLDVLVRHSLVKSFSTIIQPIISSSDVRPLNNGFIKMLEDLSLSFPANLGLFDVIGQLMKKMIVNEEVHNEIADIVAEFLENLSWFCDSRCVDMDCVREVENGGDCKTNSAKQCTLTTQYRPYCTKKTSFTLGPEHDGYFIDDNAVWAVHYSAWDVIAAEIELTYMLLSHPGSVQDFNIGPSNVTTVAGQFDRLEIILDFLVISLESDIKKDKVTKIFRQLWSLVENDSFFVEGCESALVKLINLASQVLNSTKDLELIVQIVSTKNLFPNSQASAERVVSNQSIIEHIWKGDSTSTNVALIQSYLRFNVSVIHCEKFLDTDVGIIPTSFIFGSVIFTIKSVLDNVTKRSFANSSDVTDLAADCLVYLNEIMSIKPKFYSTLSDDRKCRLELIQQMTHEIIINAPSSIKIILLMSSMEVDVLLKQCNLSNQMLAIHGTEEKLSQLVWMALTLVKYIFIGPDSMSGEPTDVNNNGASVLLKILEANEVESTRGSNRRTTMTYSQQYILRLLEFLSYPYSIKIARMSLDVLKLIVQNTNISIVACLGEKASLVRDMLLRFFSSSMDDQIVRANLFNFLSECVMCGRHGVLQLIGPGKSDENDLDNVAYQSCLDIINSFKVDDAVSVKLICSVSKFLSSLWIKECYSSIDSLKNINVWESILSPLRELLGSIRNYEPVKDRLFEFIGNTYSLFGMEFYSSSALLKSQKDPNFIKCCDELVGADLFTSFLCVFDKKYLEDRLPSLDKYMKILLQPMTWWKTLLITTLSTDNTESGLKGLSKIDGTNLLIKLLESISNLLSFSVILETNDFHIIVDQLSSCVLEMLHKTASTIVNGNKNSVVFRHMLDILSTMIQSSTIVFHTSHADLMASCVLMQHNLNNQACPEISQHEIEFLAEQYLFMITTKLSPSKLESKVLVQAINLCISTDVTPTGDVSPDWLARLAHTGVLHNCLVLLNECVKVNDTGLMPQTLVLLLIRAAHTHSGASRILQSSLLHTIETDFFIDESDRNANTFLSSLLQLSVVLITHGPIGYEFGFRLVLAHWDKFNHLIKEGCSRLGRAVNLADDYDRIGLFLLIGKFLFDLTWHLMAVRGTWSLYWPASLIVELEQMVHICTNTVAVVLSHPQTIFPPHSAYIIQGRNRSSKHLSFVGQSPRVKFEHNLSLDDSDHHVPNSTIELASSRLESILYQLLHSSLMVYSRSTTILTENCIYEGIEYNGSLLSEDFSEGQSENVMVPLSFGRLFVIINATHCLLRDDIPALSVEKEKIVFRSDLMRQIHEIVLSIIVSHGIIYLSKFDSSNKLNRNTFVSNLRSDLNYYLNDLAKNRRRNTMSSSGAAVLTPRITSTPYARKSSNLPDSFDLFCMTVDQFKKALDLM